MTLKADQLPAIIDPGEGMSWSFTTPSGNDCLIRFQLTQPVGDGYMRGLLTGFYLTFNPTTEDWDEEQMSQDQLVAEIKNKDIRWPDGSKVIDIFNPTPIPLQESIDQVNLHPDGLSIAEPVTEFNLAEAKRAFQNNKLNRAYAPMPRPTLSHKRRKY